MKKLLWIVLLLIPSVTFSQDIIVLRNGGEIDCKITKVDSTTIYYDFFRGERKISSYVAISDIRSYRILTVNEADHLQDDDFDMPQPQLQHQLQHNTVIIDTTQYVKEVHRWNNLITFSQRFGVNAKGWSLQYYGYNLRNTSNWSIPVIVGIEGFEIHSDYFEQFNYQSASMHYSLVGISPFYRLNDALFLNLGLNIIIGDEKLTDFDGREKSKTIAGLSPSQGICFIPDSSFGITVGLSVFEKLLSSEVYKNDLGLRLEIGVKF